MGYLARLATHVLNAAQGIPGMETVEAGAGALGSHVFGDRPLSFQEALETLRSATGNIGGGTNMVEKAIGTIPTLPFLPANPAAGGALLGAADQLLAPDSESLVGRGVKTAVGAGIGAVVGKGSDAVVAGARSLLAPTAAANLLERSADRAASAKRLYGAALAEGKAAGATPAIKNYLAEPDIAEIVKELKGTREFSGVAPDSPEMLDAVYKTLSDRAATIRKGLQALTPNRPNIGRYQGANITAAQQDLLDAISGGMSMPGPMPTYRAAVKDFAQRKATEDAVGKGYDALRSKLSKALPSPRNLTRTTPEAFAKWADMAGPDETRAAIEGLLGGGKSALSKAPLTMGRRAVGKLPDLLRIAGDATQVYAPRVGLLSMRPLY